MSKFRKRPVVIEAEQFLPGKSPWPKGVYVAKAGERQGEVKFQIDTPEGPFVVKPGDWIIVGIKGERYPCKPDIFEATYERVEKS